MQAEQVSQAAPRAVYQKHLAQRQGELQRSLARDRLLANLRLVVASLAALVAYLAWGAHRVSPWWLALCALAFVALVVVHDGVLKGSDKLRASIRFFEQGLLRLDGKWAGAGSSGSEFVDPAHPYAADLDLFGTGSLFELLCAAHTAAGEGRLADWLLGPAPAPEVRARQAAVQELAPKVSLREELFLRASTLRAAVHPDALVRWGEAPRVLPAWLALPLLALAGAGIFTGVGWAALGFGPLPFLAVLLFDWATGRWLRSRTSAALDALEQPGRELRVLASLLGRFENEPCSTEKLAHEQQRLASGGGASQQISRLARLIELADARRNQMFAPLAFVLLWAPLFALATETWRQRNGRSIAAWLSAVAELEALSSLAAYAFENPTDVYPELIGDGRVYTAVGLAHPLLAEAVANDVQLGTPLQLMLVSGSNMSGKSTLLRSVGVSVVMAFAGAPVRARRLALSNWSLGATLRVQDSLQSGASRFYAEIQRLRVLLELAEAKPPLLFLLDEILHGTNSHDRRIGAAAIIQAFVSRGACGLVTTHDLALASLADELGPTAANVHFEDRLEEGRLVFDYRLRPGVVQRSNAIELMRGIGIPV